MLPACGLTVMLVLGAADRPLPLTFKPGQKREVMSQDLVLIEEQALEWHDRLWSFRSEIIHV